MVIEYFVPSSYCTGCGTRSIAWSSGGWGSTQPKNGNVRNGERGPPLNYSGPTLQPLYHWIGGASHLSRHYLLYAVTAHRCCLHPPTVASFSSSNST
jgi:hypothetical protein